MGWSPRAAATMSSRAVAICAPRVRRRGRLREELAGVSKTRVAFRGAECGDTGRPELPDGERGRDRVWHIGRGHKEIALPPPRETERSHGVARQRRIAATPVQASPGRV